MPRNRPQYTYLRYFMLECTQILATRCILVAWTGFNCIHTDRSVLTGIYSTTLNLSLQKLNRVISFISESSTRMKAGRKCWLWNENRFGKNKKSTARIIIILVKIKCSRITNQSWRLSTFQEETNEHFENDSSPLQTVNIPNFQLVLTVH